MRSVTRRAIRSGDLLFFAKFTHVGMAISNREFVHATTSGHPGVQVSRIDDPHWAKRRDRIGRLTG
jgi:cell wall-associated NlpC family hydrolase